MDRVRDLVAGGGVYVVLAQDRDRIAREPAYHYLLRREFEEHGTKIRAMNDRGDDSPEGELTDGILDQLAKFERAKTAERSRWGKAREGKIICGHTPGYGFRYNEPRAGYEVEPRNMAGVRRIFGLIGGGGESLYGACLGTRGRSFPIGKPSVGETDHQGHCPGRCLPNAGLRADAGLGGGGAPDGRRLGPPRQGEALRYLVVQQIAQDAEACGCGHPERARVQDSLQERGPPP
jgi:hypothetical protein